MEGNNENADQEIPPTSNESIPLFLLKTYEILQNQSYADIICWTKTGEGFIVKKVKQFAEKILPSHFRHNNYTSFVRQLNMYDFHKTRQENQENAFKNFMFKRGHRHLLKDILRKDYKKNKETRLQPSVKEEDEIENEEKNDEQVKYARQFYKKWVPTLQVCDKQLQQRISKLAEVNHIELQVGKVMAMIDLIIEAGKTNKKTMLKVQQFCESWDCFVFKRGMSLKSSNWNQSNEGKEQNPTFTSTNELPPSGNCS